MYCVRQEFFAGTIVSYGAVNKKFIQDKQIDYYSLPTKISQQIQRANTADCWLCMEKLFCGSQGLQEKSVKISWQATNTRI